VHPQLVEEGLELGSGEALVGQDDLSAGDQGMVDLQQRRGDVTFVKLGVGQTPHQRHALDRSQGSGKVFS
jgi:hypothetical protein